MLKHQTVLTLKPLLTKIVQKDCYNFLTIIKVCFLIMIFSNINKFKTTEVHLQKKPTRMNAPTSVL